jgi:arginyl-tRNA synthetase
MQTILSIIKAHTVQALQEVYNLAVLPEGVTVNETKPEFIGDYSIVTFSFSKQLGKKPLDIAQELGAYLTSTFPETYIEFAVIQGFLNLRISPAIWLQFLNTYPSSFTSLPSGKKMMIEFSSPNTNKPLHFGHLRNNFLGESVARLLQAQGHTVVKANLLNDRGIHICKSMYAWQHFGNGETPESTGTKGDHFVGKYYVLFENKMKEEAALLVEKYMQGEVGTLSAEGAKKMKELVEAYKASSSDESKQKDLKSKITEIAKTQTTLLAGARSLLLQWEEKHPETIGLWKTMNSWVVAGFDKTYADLNISFDKYYYESETYLLGKQIVEKGVEKGVLFRKEDKSIWIDLTADGLDEKLLLRGDGTSVYITQDIGTAQLKYNDYDGLDKSIYVIADEQNYHMQVLQLILTKLQEPCAEGIHHLSYGLVELPSGRMKTREGTVVDADDIITEMKAVAAKHTQELGKVDGFSKEELETLYENIGLGALRFFLLRVDAKKKMIFNPEESIDFQGFTGPFVQYTYARTSAILRKEMPEGNIAASTALEIAEIAMIKTCEQYRHTLQLAENELNPSIICNYVFAIAKQMNGFLAEHKVLHAATAESKQVRLHICQMVIHTIGKCLAILGMAAPSKM